MSRKKKKKKNGSHFSLKTKATQNLDELMRQQLEVDFKDRPLDQVFNMFAKKEEGLTKGRHTDREVDEKHVDLIDELEKTEKDNDERTRWY